MRERGFTLIELIVTMGIAALLLVLVIPLLGGSQDRARFKAAAHDIATALRETRGRAVASGRSAALVVETAGGIYQRDGDKPRRLPREIEIVVLTTTDERLSDTKAAIRFFPDGSSTGGAVRLVSHGKRYDLLIDWLTGRVTFDDRALLPAG